MLSSWAGQPLGAEFDFRVVDVPFVMLLVDPHQRNIERQSGTLSTVAEPAAILPVDLPDTRIVTSSIPNQVGGPSVWRFVLITASNVLPSKRYLPSYSMKASPPIIRPPFTRTRAVPVPPGVRNQTL